MGARLQRSEPVRSASWDDFDAVAQALARQCRAGGGGPMERPEFVRAEWQLPSFEVGRDNWIADGGYAAVTPAGGLVLTAREERTADGLLRLAVERARERGFASLQLNVLNEDEQHARLVRVNPFELQTDVLTMWRGIGGTQPEARWPAVHLRANVRAGRRFTGACSTRRGVSWLGLPHYVPLSHADWVPLMTGDIEFDPTVWWLAESDGELVGCALWWVEWLAEGHCRARRATVVAALGGALRPCTDSPMFASARQEARRSQGRRLESDGRAPALRAAGFCHRANRADLGLEPVSGAAKVSLLRWLRRQLRQPDPVFASTSRRQSRTTIPPRHGGSSRTTSSRKRIAVTVESLLEEWERELPR